MKITDPIGDMITRIRNGQMRGLKKVSVPGSKLRKAVLDVLQKEGFIQEYAVSKDKSFAQVLRGSITQTAGLGSFPGEQASFRWKETCTRFWVTWSKPHWQTTAQKF